MTAAPLPGWSPAELDHVGLAVHDLDAAVELHRSVLGLHLLSVEDVAAHGVREALLAPGPGPGTRVQLLQPLSDASPVARFLARRGEGLHHLAYRVGSLDDALARLATGDPPLQPVAPGVTRGGGGARVAFLHPRDLGGVLTELVERG
ncbi:methylmalonyl-CoA/ethylmalonyl-CoA epimerase [Motilibacter peucedani]|uniref:Methylmalonyl-CoA/ethylmalonyl-CoA epimerase n=1 Tax=Motilibacter peucedani TaxID=598650 RepID=A0A420XLH6_9ACTN|nr:methylmalonyl-CoA epimerase [Motilibacter peucedani]RKS71342.1 methylmalonyl-CoA/ethylmalonyl-CoA epimerase [Motilibacter peucedani]